MKKIILKALEFAAIIIGLLIGIFVATNIRLESMFRKKEEPITLAMTKNGLQEDFIGLPAGDDIPRVEDNETWEDTWSVSCITIEPTAIISTGFGVRHTWIPAYRNSNTRGSSKKRADVIRMTFDLLDEYAEYQILQLPDQSYILAQIPKEYVRQLKAGKQITLPIGKKSAVHRQVLKLITEQCQEYHVDTTGVFYCINDKWNESYSFMVQLVRYGIGFVVALVIGTVLITLIDKILHVFAA